MNDADVQSVKEGDLITFQRKTKATAGKPSELVNQLGFVSRLNTEDGTASTPTASLNIYILTKDDQKPNISVTSKGLPEEKTREIGLDAKYRIYNVPLKVDATAFTDGQTQKLDDLSPQLVSGIQKLIKTWEEKAGTKLNFKEPNRLAGTGFMRFTPPAPQSLSATMEAAAAAPEATQPYELVKAPSTQPKLTTKPTIEPATTPDQTKEAPQEQPTATATVEIMEAPETEKPKSARIEAFSALYVSGDNLGEEPGAEDEYYADYCGLLYDLPEDIDPDEEGLEGEELDGGYEVNASGMLIDLPENNIREP